MRGVNFKHFFRRAHQFGKIGLLEAGSFREPFIRMTPKTERVAIISTHKLTLLYLAPQNQTKRNLPHFVLFCSSRIHDGRQDGRRRILGSHFPNWDDTSITKHCLDSSTIFAKLRYIPFAAQFSSILLSGASFISLQFWKKKP